MLFDRALRDVQPFGDLPVGQTVDAAHPENPRGPGRQAVAQRQHLFDQQRRQRRVVGRVEKIAQGERLPRPGLLQLVQIDAVVKYLVPPQPVQTLVVGHREEVGGHLGTVQAGTAPEELVENLLNDVVAEVPAAGHAVDIGAQPRIKSRKHLFYLLFGISEIWNSGMKHLLSGKLTAERYPKPYLTSSRAPYKSSRSGRSPGPRPPSRPARA